MKNIKKRVFLYLTTLVLVLSMASVAFAAKPKLSSKSITLTVGKKKTITLKNTKKSVKWTTSNKKIATIKKKGKNKVVITAKKAGTCKVTGKIGSKKYVCKVKVQKKKSKSSGSGSSGSGSSGSGSGHNVVPRPDPKNDVFYENVSGFNKDACTRIPISETVFGNGNAPTAISAYYTLTTTKWNVFVIDGYNIGNGMKILLVADAQPKLYSANGKVSCAMNERSSSYSGVNFSLRLVWPTMESTPLGGNKSKPVKVYADVPSCSISAMGEELLKASVRYSREISDYDFVVDYFNRSLKVGESCNGLFEFEGLVFTIPFTVTPSW